jgi:hypothetical protein
MLEKIIKRLFATQHVIRRGHNLFQREDFNGGVLSESFKSGLSWFCRELQICFFLVLSKSANHGVARPRVVCLLLTIPNFLPHFNWTMN